MVTATGYWQVSVLRTKIAARSTNIEVTGHEPGPQGAVEPSDVASPERHVTGEPDQPDIS
jgi:hypothetical protein